MEQQIISGLNSIQELINLLPREKKVFLVHGRSSFKKSGAESVLAKIPALKDCIHFSDFELNPDIKDIKKGLHLFLRNNCNLVLCIGGGSAIDIAKSIAILSGHRQPGENQLPALNDLEQLITGKQRLTSRKTPLIAIPTTAGTGSESTHFAVVYINKKKYSLADHSMLPDSVILDPALGMSMPAYTTACTGADALSQAIESYWSVLSTSESRTYSKAAIEIILENLPVCVKAPDIKSRTNMLKAANLAGKAINISKTTAAHALSYPFTSYFSIPHGHAVMLSLPYFLELNSNFSNNNIQESRGPNFLALRMNELICLLGTNSADTAKEKLLAMTKEIGLETNLSKLNITAKDLELIVSNGFNPERVKNNPVKISKEDLLKMLKGML